MEAEQKLRQLTEETDWEKLLPDLVEYARRRSQGGMRWRGAGGGAVPGGYEAEDFAHEALVQLLAEERNWNPEKETLKEFVKGVISSKVSHRAESRENSLERRATSVREEANAALVYVSEETAPAAETPDALLLEKEERALLLASLENDPVARAVAELVIDEDLYKSHDSHLIAERLYISDAHVHYAKKRLRRRLGELLEARRRRKGKSQPRPPA